MYVGMVMQYTLFVEAEKVDTNLADTLKETAEKESKGVTVVVMKTDKKIMDTIIQDAVALYVPTLFSTFFKFKTTLCETRFEAFT